MVTSPKDKLKSLRDNLIKDNYELPDYETFKKDLSDDKKLKAFRENLIKDNYELPDYETFKKDLGFGEQIVAPEQIGNRTIYGVNEGLEQPLSAEEEASKEILSVKEDGTKKLKGTIAFPEYTEYPDGSIKENDLVSIAKGLSELSRKGTYETGLALGGIGGGGSVPTFTIDKDAAAKIVEQTSLLKGLGINDSDITNIQKDFSDLPKQAVDYKVIDADGNESNPYSYKEFSNLYQTNPLGYITKLNAAKNYFKLLNERGVAVANNYADLQFKNISSISINSGVRQFNQLKEAQKEIIRKNLEGEDRDKAIERIEVASSAWLDASIATSDDAEKYLNDRIYDLGKNMPLNKPDLLKGPDAEYTGNVNDYSLESISSVLDTKSESDNIAFIKYKKKIDLKKSLDETATLDEAAILFARKQDPNFDAQMIKLEEDGEKLPSVAAGKYVSDFLNSPEVIEIAKDDQVFAEGYSRTKSNIVANYPDFATKNVAEKISQEMEDTRQNNWLVNIPTKDKVNTAIQGLVEKGILTEQDVVLAQKYILPEVGIPQSVGRGFARFTPFLQAVTPEAKLRTPGLAEAFQNGVYNTLRGAANTIQDIMGATSLSYTPSEGSRIYRHMTKSYSELNIIPKSTLHKVSEETGNLLGMVAVMAAGGGALGEGEATHMISNALIFEGNNSDEAQAKYGDDLIKKYLYTYIATGIDMALTKVLPITQIQKGLGIAVRDEAGVVIAALADNKITQEQAKVQILEKIVKLVPSLLKENTKTAATMTGYGIAHNVLDAVLGGNKMGAGEILWEGVQSFKSSFLSSGGLTLLSAKGSMNKKLGGKIIREIADNPKEWVALVEQQAKLNPSIKENKNEIIANIYDLALIKRDLNSVPANKLNDNQRSKYLVESINQKINERRAEESTDDIIKKSYLDKAKEHQLNKEKIFKGEDVANDYQDNVPVSDVTEDIAQNEFFFLNGKSVTKEEFDAQVAKGEEANAEVDLEYDGFDKETIANLEAIGGTTTATEGEATNINESNKAEVEKLRVDELNEMREAIPGIDNYIVDGVVDKTKITDATDLENYNRIYDKYYKLITPKLKEISKVETKVEITPEDISLHENATEQQASEALTKTLTEYEQAASEQRIEETTTRISEEVLSKPIEQLTKAESPEPGELSDFDTFRNSIEPTELARRFESEGLKDFGETVEEFLLRIYC